MNRFGRTLSLQIFGESHGPAIGGVIDGIPPGLDLDVEHIQSMLDRRRPGTDSLVSQRKESDTPEFLSGLYNGRTTGDPVAFLIQNTDARPTDYAGWENTPRPGHADFTRWVRSRGHFDPRGGGHHSGRLTACLVVAGAIAKQALQETGVAANAQTIQIGTESVAPYHGEDLLERVSNSRIGCAHPDAESRLIAEIEAARNEADSVGGVVHGSIRGLPAGLGEPFFDGVESHLAHLLLSIPAAKGVSFGAGFESARMRGSEHNDPIKVASGPILTSSSNHAGGALGGYSTGQPVTLRVAFKPASTIGAAQQTVNVETSEAVELAGKGRHDPCIVPRAVVVVESCLWIAAADLLWTARGTFPEDAQSG